jgi:hypothetical protein
MLHDKSILCVIKTRENYCFYYVFVSYLKAGCIVNAPCLSVCGLRQQAVLRASYSQRAMLGVWCSQQAVLRVWCSQILSVLARRVLRASYSQRHSLRVCSSQHCLVMLLPNSGGNKKTTIGKVDNRRLMTLVNSASTAAPIGLPPKGAKFCHTSNRLLVGHQCRSALLQLYFNSSAVSWLVSQSLVGPQWKPLCHDFWRGSAFVECTRYSRSILLIYVKVW